MTVALVFFGCSNVAETSDGSAVSTLLYQNIAQKKSTRSVEVKIDSQEDNSISRTLVSASINFTAPDSNYHFYLWCKGVSSNEKIAPREVTFDASSGKTGTFALDFPALSYYFTLAVTDGPLDDISNGEKILSKAILAGYTTADLRYTNSLKFYLTTYGLHDCYGDIDINMLLDSSWTDEEVLLQSEYRISAGLYLPDTNFSVDNVLPSGYAPLSKTVPTKFTLKSFPVGTYDFCIKFEKIGSGTVYMYSDRIIVHPNRTVIGTVKVPFVIEKKPLAPTDFKASYICPDVENDFAGHVENDYYDSLANTTDYYRVLFSWQDNSVNEEYFKITMINLSLLQEFPEIPDVMTDADWNRIIGLHDTNTRITRVFDTNFQFQEEYYAGTLMANSQAAMVLLPLGYSYIAKIQSVNSAGISSSCYVTLDKDFSVQVPDDDMILHYNEYTGVAFSKDSAPTKVINLHKIVYHLDGGTLAPYRKQTGTLVASYARSSLTEFYTVKNSSILQPTSEYSQGTEASPALTKLVNATRYKWSSWTLNSISGTLYSNPSHDGYTNLHLFANYQ